MMAAVGGMWAPVAMRLLRVAVVKTTAAVRARVANAAKPLHNQAQLFGFPTASTGRQAIHPIAAIRQSRRLTRWHHTNVHKHLAGTIRQFMNGANTNGARLRIDRSKFPTSKTSTRLSRFTGQAPFASTLRPNLTGGAIPRTAGGYTVGGGSARYFSHSPAAPAEVINNVSAAVRAFWTSGQRARFNGVDAQGRAQYRAVSDLEDEAARQLYSCTKTTPGSFVDFHLSPTITALSPLASTFPFESAAIAWQQPQKPSSFAGSLSQEGMLNELAADFARAFKDLSIIFSDIKRIAALGDLPVKMEKPNVLRVRFPGVDAGTLERLCDDLGVQRGSVGEDPDFALSMGVPVALKFPFAPGSEGSHSMASPRDSLRSMDSEDVEEAFMELEDNVWFSDPECHVSSVPHSSSFDYASQDYEGLEGIYKFLQECDRPPPAFASR